MLEDKALYKRVLDNQRTAVLLLDPELNIRYVNAGAEALLYTGSHKLVGTSLAAYFHDTPGAEHVMTACRRDGQSITCREVELRDAIGHIQLVDYSVRRLDEVHMAPTLLIEIQPVNQLLRISREEGWQQAHHATRQLVRGVAHEMKNPLGGIRGSAQLLAASLPDNEWQEYLDVIVNESKRLGELADRLLGARKAPTMHSINIHECVERVRQLVQVECSDVPIQRDYDPSLPNIAADRDQIIQVLLNLMRNAAQALLENQVNNGRIVLRTRALRQFTLHGERHRLVLQIDVEDNGPGVPTELQESLFFPLVTGRATGTGLGLALVHDIIHQHQGLVECNSRPGRTCFSVLLPLRTQAGTRVTPAATGEQHD